MTEVLDLIQCEIHRSRPAVTVICLKCGDLVTPERPTVNVEFETNVGKFRIEVLVCDDCGEPTLFGFDSASIQLLKVNQIEPPAPSAIALCQQCDYWYADCFRFSLEEWQQIMQGAETLGITLERALRLHLATNCDYEVCDFFPRCQAPLERSEDYETTNDFIGCRQCGALHDMEIVFESLGAEPDPAFFNCPCGTALFLGHAEDLELDHGVILGKQIERLGGQDQAEQALNNRAFVCRDCALLYDCSWSVSLSAFEAEQTAKDSTDG